MDEDEGLILFCECVGIDVLVVRVCVPELVLSVLLAEGRSEEEEVLGGFIVNTTFPDELFSDIFTTMFFMYEFLVLSVFLEFMSWFIQQPLEPFVTVNPAQLEPLSQF